MEQEGRAGGVDGQATVAWLRDEARALGFSQIGVADVDLSSAEPGLAAWLERGWHGTMQYMARHGLKRARPAELVPGTLRVITARMDYLPRSAPPGWQSIEFGRLSRPRDATVSFYARRDDAQRARHQLGGPRALQAVARHVLHRAVPAALEPRRKPRLGAGEIHVGHTDL